MVSEISKRHIIIEKNVTVWNKHAEEGCVWSIPISLQDGGSQQVSILAVAGSDVNVWATFKKLFLLVVLKSLFLSSF